VANPYTKQKYKKFPISPPKQMRDFKDGINDKFNNTIWEDRGYGALPGKVRNVDNPHPDSSERDQAKRMGRSTPTKRLNNRGQDARINSEDFGIGPRNPDGSRYINLKNRPSKLVRPS
jgi:hypothetical protein